MSKIKAAIFGIEHPHAISLYKAMKLYPDDFDILGFADVPSLDEQEHKSKLGNIGAAAVNECKEYEDWHELLDLRPDFAVIATNNADKAKVACEIMSRGINVLGEKPMAPTYADAVKMAKCAKENGVSILTNWPVAWFSAFKKAKELADAGRIGKITRVIYRSPATWGPYSFGKDGVLPPTEFMNKTWWYKNECGGGSLLDYAGYGTMLSTWFFGHQAYKVSGIKKTYCTGFSNVEDYSLLTLDFGEGVGVAEGSWSTFNSGEIPNGPIIYGTDGTIVCDRYSNTVKLYTKKSHKILPPDEVFETENPGADIQLGKNLAEFLKGRGEINPLLTAEFNLSVVAALDAGRKSAETGIIEKTEKEDI